jgi:acetylornithine deacetylase/succinyl-diaminopimelate desuccinylase-like protein
MELDCRILPGAAAGDVEREVRARLGDDIPYELAWPEPLVPGSGSPGEGPLMTALHTLTRGVEEGASLLPMLGTGFTDSLYLRERGATAYGFSPYRHTPTDVLEAGYHNADERVHVDDLVLSARFHADLARRMQGGDRAGA